MGEVIYLDDYKNSKKPEAVVYDLMCRIERLNKTLRNVKSLIDELKGLESKKEDE